MNQLISGFNKLLVANGEGNLNSVEVVNLQNDNKRCSNLPDFNLTSTLNIGFLLNNNTPVICGGQDSTSSRSECYSLKPGANKWTTDKFLNVPRGDSAIVGNSAKTEFIVIGGQNSDTLMKSMEVYSSSGWTSLKNADLAIGIRSSCAVAYTSTTILLIGGWTENMEASQATFLFNKTSHAWYTFLPLETGRRHHSCGMMQLTSTSGNYVVVAGGWNGKDLSSTEILEPGSSNWKFGPDLPGALQGGSIVEDTSGKRILYIGGSNDASGISSDIFALSFLHTISNQWEILPQKLQQPRKFATAFFIPNQFVSCSEITPETTTELTLSTSLSTASTTVSTGSMEAITETTVEITTSINTESTTSTVAEITTSIVTGSSTSTPVEITTSVTDNSGSVTESTSSVTIETTNSTIKPTRSKASTLLLSKSFVTLCLVPVIMFWLHFV